jgi:hypothetical protein
LLGASEMVVTQMMSDDESRNPEPKNCHARGCRAVCADASSKQEGS